MPDFILGLVCVVISLIIAAMLVAVIGHGLWLMFAAFFGERKAAIHDANERHLFRTCIGCGNAFFSNAGACEQCGLDSHSDKARELKDLVAAARAVQRLLESGKLTPELSEQVYKSIETRQSELLPRKRESVLTPVQQLEIWFGADLGKNLSIEEKKQGLQIARSLQTADLHRLSAYALVGAARLLTAVGMLSRACQFYDVLFVNYPNASITTRSANAALRIAEDLNESARVEEWTRLLNRAKPMEAADIRAETPTPVLDLAAIPVQARAVEPTIVAPAAVRQVQAPELVAPIEPPAPRRSFAEWIGVFMEERNIMWGELIGGTLIVGCSIALVISLWSKMQEVIPIFPFIILAAVTSALFTAGLYTLHHWKLESTSRGLLVIGTLLVPLNFLVLAGLSKPGESGWVEYLAEAAALAVFNWLLYRSSHVLIQTPLNIPMPSAAAFTGAMLVSVIAQLFAPHWLAHQEWKSVFHYLLTLLPVLAFGASIGWVLLGMRKVESWTGSGLAAMLFALAALTFACGVNLCFVIWFPAASMKEVLLDVSPALTLLGVPILIAGTLMHQRLTLADRAQFAWWRTLGTGIALLGLFVMFGGFIVSVDSLPHCWFSGALSVATLLGLAWNLRLPLLHIPMQVYLAALTVFGLPFEFDALMVEPIAASRLCGLLILQAMLAELLLRFDRRLDGRIYAIGAAVTTALAIATMFPLAATHPGAMALVLGCASSVWLLSNMRWRAAEITYACTLALGGSFFFASRYLLIDLPFAQHLLWSALTLATLCLLVSMSLRVSAVGWVTNAFRVPLQFASLFATVGIAALLIVELPRGQSWAIIAIACGWLAALWCVIAVVEGWPMLFGVFQAALGFTWFFGIGAWLHQMEWARFEPYSLHLYALGFASLSLAWELTRILLRSNPRALTLLTPAFVPIDRLTSAALIFLQFGLTMLLSVGSFGRELSFTPEAWRAFPADWHEHAFSIWVWLITFVLAGVLIAWLREFDLRLPALGLTLLLLTLPLLVAGTWFDAQLASASAARWGLAVVYGVVSLLLWNRQRLGEERAELVPVVAMRGLLIVGAVLPMLSITLLVAVTRIGGHLLPGPLAESIFVQMGRPVSLLVPLALLSATLAGHGVRERAARYLFAAGLLINLSTVGGFFLVLQRLEIPRGQAWVAVDALLLSASVAWLWSMAWSGLLRMRENDGERALDDPILLKVNVVLGILPVAIVLANALVWIMFFNDDFGRTWAQEAGSPWGWITFAFAAGGSCFLSWNRRAAVPMHVIGAWSLLGVGLIACSVEFVSPGNSFVALMFGSGVFACAWVWFTMLFDPAQRPSWLLLSHHRVESALYATIAAGLAIFLSCDVLFKANDLAIWSANSVVLAATAFALLAYQVKKEIWATLATAALMLGSTILVIHFVPDHPHLELCIALTCLAVLGASSLVRLALHPLLNAEDKDVGDLQLLPMQIVVALLAVLLLSGSCVLALIVVPAHPDLLLKLRDNASQGELIFLACAGWVAMLTNAITSVWYMGRTWPRWVVHTIALDGLCLGAGLALSADLFFEPAWLAHHVLTLTWTLLSMAILILSWLSHAQDAVGPQFWSAEKRTGLADRLRRCFPERSARFWVTLCGAIVVMFALRVMLVEPERPYWSIGNTLAVSVLLGTLAVWTRAPFYTFCSGLLANVIGLLVSCAWSAHRNQVAPLLGQDEWISVFVLAQILSFGASAIVWSFLERRLIRNGIDVTERVRCLPFSQFAILAGVHVLAISVALANGSQLTGDDMRIHTPLAWIALGVIVAAALLEIWRSRFHRFKRFQLYTCGLIAVALVLHGLRLPNPAEWYRYATVLLAGYVLLIVTFARIVFAIPALQDLLGIQTDDDEQPSIAFQPTNSEWFWHAQLLSIGVVVALSIWITNAFETWPSRLSGAFACLLVTIAAFLLVKIWHRVANVDAARTSLMPRYLAMTLGLLVALEVGWALLDLTLPAIHMQRAALTFTTLVAVMFVCRFALPRLLSDEGWVASSRWMGAVLGVLSVVLLFALLGFELVAYNVAEKRTPLLLALALPSGVALLALTCLALHSALSKTTDPFGIEGDGRSWYVYLMEVLGLLLLTHVRLNVPDLVHPLVGQYWYLVVSVLAFLGVALAETLKRKRLPVLSVPIKRSAVALAFVPVIAFRLAPFGVWCDGLKGPIPGVAPFLRYLEGMAILFHMEALCWLLLGIFLGTLARLHRSANFGIVAALAINFGLWVLLGHADATQFIARPQLWLIPLGLIVLVAEYVNRDRLGFYPSLSVRYVGLLCIYLSSTIEMFMEKLHPALAIALAVIAVIGMLLGILFRVRAFLLTGFMALLVVIFAQIWNAAVLHSFTWVWWASGIVLGVVILVMFALFEKHRNEVAKLLDNMKRWQ